MMRGLQVKWSLSSKGTLRHQADYSPMNYSQLWLGYDWNRCSEASGASSIETLSTDVPQQHLASDYVSVKFHPQSALMAPPIASLSLWLSRWSQFSLHLTPRTPAYHLKRTYGSSFCDPSWLPFKVWPSLPGSSTLPLGSLGSSSIYQCYSQWTATYLYHRWRFSTAEGLVTDHDASHPLIGQCPWDLGATYY